MLSLCHTQLFHSHLITLNVLGIKLLFKEEIFGTSHLKRYVMRYNNNNNKNNNTIIVLQNT